jgi:hypothetical protein
VKGRRGQIEFGIYEKNLILCRKRRACVPMTYCTRPERHDPLFPALACFLRTSAPFPADAINIGKLAEDGAEVRPLVGSAALICASGGARELSVMVLNDYMRSISSVCVNVRIVS